MQNYVISVLHENELREHFYLFIINRGYDMGRDVCGCETKMKYFPKIS